MMWNISDNYGDDPAPRRYFLKEKTAAADEAALPDWPSFSVTLMRALQPFAEARAAVLAAFGNAGVVVVPASP